jgi:16S rRNA (guanine527-N7)-methyltransferase
MTEDEAHTWLGARGWLSGEIGDRLRMLAAAIIAENEVQNLVSRSTLPQLWARHMVDSAQLVPHAENLSNRDGNWVDLGTGAGFPGLVVACLVGQPVYLVEVRPLRAAFLTRMVAALGCPHVTVLAAKAEAVRLPPAAIISARAFAPTDRLFASAAHLADSQTLWLLPKGRQAQKELASATSQWQGVFHVEQSVTEPESSIIVARQVAPRNRPPTHRRDARFPRVNARRGPR